MIPYHGTPISGRNDEAAVFLRRRHGLVSFAAPHQLAVVAEVCASFVFDSGAFSKWRKGGTMDVAGYLEWCSRWSRHPGFDWALIPDIIDGSEEDNDALLCEWPAAVSGVPVWHLHESLERLERLLSDYERVALGSSGEWRTPGSREWWCRIKFVMAICCDDDGRPLRKLHGLRMLNPDIFTRVPLASADSANAGINAGSLSRFGGYIAPSAGVRASIIADRIEAFNSPAVWEPNIDPTYETASMFEAALEGL